MNSYTWNKVYIGFFHYSAPYTHAHASLHLVCLMHGRAYEVLILYLLLSIKHSWVNYWKCNFPMTHRPTMGNQFWPARLGDLSEFCCFSSSLLEFSLSNSKGDRFILGIKVKVAIRQLKGHILVEKDGPFWQFLKVIRIAFFSFQMKIMISSNK